MPKQLEKIGHYVIERQIGMGSFATVFLAKHELLNKHVAIKRIAKKRINVEKNLAKCQNELKLYKKLHHENIIQMFEVIDTPDSFCIVMEYATEGDLHMAVSRRLFTETEARIFFRQIIRGVEYCHINKVAHRDLKLENILVTQRNLIKICDFGLSSMLRGGNFMQSSCGSIRYADPELLMGKEYSGEMADVWSCGVILFAILTGYLPFEDDVCGLILKKIRINKIDFPDHISEDARDLVSMILRPEVNSRLQIQEIKMHKWFVYESLGRQLDFQLSFDQMKLYSTFWSKRVNKELLKQIVNADFDFSYHKTEEEKEAAILQKQKEPFVVGYHILFYEKIKQEFTGDLKDYNNYHFNYIQSLFREKNKYNGFLESFHNLKVDSVNCFLSKNWRVGIPCSFTLKRIFRVILQLFNTEKIRVDIENRDEYKFVCFVQANQYHPFDELFRMAIYDDTDEYFLDFLNESVPELRFIMIMKRVYQALQSN